MGTPSPILTANLKALMKIQRLVANRICLPVDDGHLSEDEEGNPTYLYRNLVMPLCLPAEKRGELLGQLTEGRSALLIGAGDAGLVQQMLAASGRQPLHVWDRDPAVMRVLLGQWDFTRAIGRRRLRLCLGADLVTFLDGQPDVDVIVHPQLARVYQTEVRACTEGLARPRALVGTGGLYVDDVTDTLRAAGYGVLPLELVKVSPEEIDHTVRTVAPSLMVGINYVKGTEALAERHGVPFLCWEIDPTTDSIASPDGPTSRFHLYTYREAQVAGFREAGFEHVAYHPLAANPARRRPVDLSAEERTRYGTSVSYVGSSMMAQARNFERRYLDAYSAWRGGPEHRRAGRHFMDTILALQRLDFSAYRVRQLMGVHLADFLDAMRARNSHVDTTVWLGEIAAMEKRLSTVASLSGFGVRVWGDEGWQAIAGAGVEVMGRARHGSELTAIYNASQINIDIGRIYQSDIVTMRVFDVLACGAFLLAEHSDALADLFEIGVEVETWSSAAELQDKVRWYLDHPAEREAISRRGLEAVRSRHTISQRVGIMLDAVSAQGGPSLP